MSAQHTPGLLHVDPKRSLRISTDQDESLASTGTSDVLRDSWEANARRLVACWNACDGIPTDDLEECPSGGLLHLADHANQLAIQRDELLAALKEARRWIGDGECSDGLAREHWTPEYRAAVDRIDAAMAKVTGEQT